MGKKIKIITIFDSTNYGNRLQNYALSELLGDYTSVVSTVRYINSKGDFFQGTIEVLRLFRDRLALIISRIKTLHPFLAGEREKVCDRFSSKRITVCSNILVSMSADDVDVDDDSFYVLGSDQIWNYPWFSESNLSAQLGAYVPEGKPVISYAASFGVSEIDDDVKPIFQKYLPRLKAVSVREDRGTELIKEMTGLDATVVLDPTLMLTTDKWLKITENFVPNNDKYVLTYFLGRPSNEQERDIQAYAKTHGCRVRRMLDLRDKETYVAGPQDFVELFSKAQYVFTDSYHACCFSILFHKQFTVFNRAGMTGKSSMNSRMETLFRLFDLDSVMIDSGLAPDIDYGKVNRLLEQHRKESRSWLEKAMEN